MLIPHRLPLFDPTRPSRVYPFALGSWCLQGHELSRLSGGAQIKATTRAYIVDGHSRTYALTSTLEQWSHHLHILLFGLPRPVWLSTVIPDGSLPQPTWEIRRGTMTEL